MPSHETYISKAENQTKLFDIDLSSFATSLFELDSINITNKLGDILHLIKYKAQFEFELDK